MWMAERRMRAGSRSSLLEKLLVGHAGWRAGTHMDTGSRGRKSQKAPVPHYSPKQQKYQQQRLHERVRCDSSTRTHGRGLMRPISRNTGINTMVRHTAHSLSCAAADEPQRHPRLVETPTKASRTREGQAPAQHSSLCRPAGPPCLSRRVSRLGLRPLLCERASPLMPEHKRSS